MLNGMARRAAKSGPAAGQQDEPGTSQEPSSSEVTAGREEETEEEAAGSVVESRSGTGKTAAVGKQSSGGGGSRKSTAVAGTEEEREEASEERDDKETVEPTDSVGTEEEGEEAEEMDTGTVPQLDGADKEGKRDKKETVGGVKRGRGSMSGAPPTKTMQLSSGEKVATTLSGEGEGEEEEEEGEGGTELDGTKKQSKQAKQDQPTRKSSSHRPRTRSLSNSDSPLAPGVTTPTKTSPMTRSHSAVKKDVEFVSLPSTKKRKKGTGRWPKRDTPSPSPSVESSKAETPTKPQPPSRSNSQTKITDSKKVPNKESEMTGAEEGDGGEENEEIEDSAAAPPQQAAPPKRRRGRPPKRKDSTTPTSSAGKGKSTGSSGATGGGGGGRGRGKGRSLSGDSAETEKKSGGKTKGESGSSSSSSKEKHPESKGAERKGSKSSSSVKDDGEEGEEITEPETPLPDNTNNKKTETEPVIMPSKPTTTAPERKKKKKERRASGEDGKMNEGKSGKSSRKASAASLEEEPTKPKVESPTDKYDGGLTETGERVAGEKDLKRGGGGGKVSSSRGSVFVSVVTGPANGSATATGSSTLGKNETASDDKTKKEEVVDVVESREPGKILHDHGATPTEEAIAKPQIVQSSCSPTMPYPTTTIHPFHPHAAYPYPGPYPPPMMFPAPSNPLYPPHYYHGYPPLPPPPPPTASQPMPGSFIPPCPSDPISSPFPVSQPLTTAMGGVQVTVMDKTPTAPTPHSPHSPHPISTQQQQQQQQPHPPHPLPALSQATTHTVAMELARHYPQPHPHPLSHTYRPGVIPGPGTPPYIAPSPYISVRIDHAGMPFVDWGVPQPHLPPHHPKMDELNKNSGKLEAKQEEVPVQSVECPECGRSFKNNKALNGHMRLHGGFDWTKKPFSANQNQTLASSSSDTSTDAATGNKPHPPNETKKTSSSASSSLLATGTKKRSKSRSPSPAGTSSKKRRSSHESNGRDGEKKTGEPSFFTFPSQVDPSQHVMPPPPVLQDAGTMTGAAAVAAQSAGTSSGVGPRVGASKGGATLDDLCRAVEALEKMENGRRGGGGGGGGKQEEEDKRRPGNIQIPTHTSPSLDKHRLGSSPPYTPPPILSPARSMAILSAVPGTPSRILQPWSARRTSDHRKPSEVEEGGTGGAYLEPKINVGRQFQASLPSFSEDGTQASQDVHKAHQVWRPLQQSLDEDEGVVDGFLELACSPAILHAGRNKEYALHILHNTGGSIKEAVRLLLTGKSAFSGDHPMTTYHYSGTKHWTARERQQFRRAWRVHRKQFHLLKSAVEGKTLSEVTEFYYYWKKYCSDEYRGRNRHVSEEILSDEEMTGRNSHSSDASSSSSETEPPHQAQHHGHSDADKSVDKHQRRPRGGPGGEAGSLPRPPLPPHFDLPVVYAPHTSKPPHGAPVQQYKCKYPGCTQVFTSIFALNGHIRIHGGSFYPKADKKEVRSVSPSVALSSSSSSSSSNTTSSSAPPTVLPPSNPHHSSSSSLPPTSRPGSNGPVKHGRPPSSAAAEMRSAQHLEIARALLDLPQPRSPARGGAYHTPSPKPSPGSKRSPVGKKKMSSSSPGEHEGYYPCNRCGRVFTKVKSRSAHMKSHIMKPS